jgi:hypothetical protein
MKNILKYIQYGLIALTVIPCIALIMTADTFTRIMAGIAVGSAAFYYIIDLIRKGKLEEK